MYCNNCEDPEFDSCTFYTGPDIDVLCIKNGDSMKDVTKSITDAILLISTGEGIVLDLILSSGILKDYLYNKEYTAENVIQALIQFSENLETKIEALEDVVYAPISVNAPCLTLPTIPSKDDILKATAEKVCSLNTAVTNITSDYVKASDICTIVTSCIENSVSESDSSATIVQEYTKMPKYCPIAYTGPMSVFDSTGKGIEAQGYKNIYVCNGNNGTDDLRGRSLIGANVNVSGPTLDAAVDPSVAANAGYSIAVKTKKGSFTHSLQSLENGPHGHTINDPGHSHYIAANGSSTPLTSGNTMLYFKEGLNNNSYQIHGTSSPASMGKSSTANTGISLASSGNGNPHNNTHPSFGVNYIIYLP